MYRRGFTLPELMVVMPIAMLVMGTFFGYMTILYIDNLKQINKISVVNDVNRALNVMTNDIQIGFNFSTALSTGITDDYGPAGSWNGNANIPTSTLVTRLPASTASRQNPGTQIVRENQNGCEPENLISNPVHFYNVVHFVENGNLYRRTLIEDSPPPLCGSVFQKTSCPESANQPGCARDTLLASDVTEFRVRYEVPKNGTPPNATCPSGTTESSPEDGLSVCLVSNPNNASVVTVLLTVSRNAGGEEFTYGHRFTMRPLNKEL